MASSGPRRGPRRPDRALGGGLILSAAIHAAVLVTVSRFLGVSAASPTGSNRPGAPVGGLRIVAPSGSDGAVELAGPSELEPAYPGTLAGPEPSRRPSGMEERATRASDVFPGPPLRRFRRRPAPDPRLHGPTGPGPLQDGPPNIRLPGWRLGLALQPVRDSTRWAGEARLEFDWTGTDGARRRWGLSDLGLHVAGMRISLEIGDPAGGTRTGEWDAMRTQAARGATHETLRERSRALRERMERQRRGRGGGG